MKLAAIKAIPIAICRLMTSPSSSTPRITENIGFKRLIAEPRTAPRWRIDSNRNTRPTNAVSTPARTNQPSADSLGSASSLRIPRTSQTIAEKQNVISIDKNAPPRAAVPR